MRINLIITIYKVPQLDIKGGMTPYPYLNLGWKHTITRSYLTADCQPLKIMSSNIKHLIFLCSYSYNLKLESCYCFIGQELIVLQFMWPSGKKLNCCKKYLINLSVNYRFFILNLVFLMKLTKWKNGSFLVKLKLLKPLKFNMELCHS